MAQDYIKFSTGFVKEKADKLILNSESFDFKPTANNHDKHIKLYTQQLRPGTKLLITY